MLTSRRKRRMIARGVWTRYRFGAKAALFYQHARRSRSTWRCAVQGWIGFSEDDGNESPKVCFLLFMDTCALRVIRGYPLERANQRNVLAAICTPLMGAATPAALLLCLILFQLAPMAYVIHVCPCSPVRRLDFLSSCNGLGISYLKRG
jgi:hypothetical protein